MENNKVSKLTVEKNKVSKLTVDTKKKDIEVIIPKTLIPLFKSAHPSTAVKS